jgi:hypothetical protein
MPDFSQSFNRYSYCLNNPLMYVDKDGEAWWLIPVIAAGVFAAGNTAAHAIRGDINNFGDFLNYFSQGAVMGFALGCAWQFAPMIPFIGQGIQTIMTTYTFIQLGIGVSGMVSAANNYGWDGLGRAGEIFLGNFYLDENSWIGGVWQGFTRHTWEMIQQLGGHGISQYRNTFKAIDAVEYFGGATFTISDENGKPKDTGNSWGSFINITITDKYKKEYNYTNNKFDPLKGRGIYMHEYGHYIDSRSFGPSYLFAIGIPSSKELKWVERRANINAAKYTKMYFDMDWPFESDYPTQP